MNKYVYTSYQKILASLKTMVRGRPFDKADFLKERSVLDETKKKKQYRKKFGVSNLAFTGTQLHREMISGMDPINKKIMIKDGGHVSPYSTSCKLAGTE